jgi:uncharacterized membrane protein YfcA
MGATVLLALFGVGLAVGFLSGLVGIGGGVLIVPFLYFFYAHPGWSGTAVPGGLEAAIAHATSLFIIVPTAIRGTIAYHRSKVVAWRVALPVAVASAVAAVAGARTALALPEAVLKLLFGLLLITSGVQLIRKPETGVRRDRRVTVLRSATTGVLVGLLSAMLGVGGGLVAIPMLIYVVGLEITQVAATSLAIVTFAATSGMITYVVSGWGATGLPPGSLGFVHVAAALPMLAGSVISVRWGAVANQRLPARTLRMMFAILFILLGIKLLVENVGALR